MEDFIKIEVTDDAHAVTSELYVEDTVENPALYTIEDNHVSLVSENIEKVIKLETDTFDDCMWTSRIEIAKDVDNQSIMELPLEYQDVADNNIYLNHGNTSDKTFHCYICGKSFVLNHLLKNHMAEHKGEVHRITHECKYCGKQFKLRFGLNRHIQKHHNPMYKCRICRLSVDCSKYIEHEEYHERKDNTVYILRDTPYFCIRKLANIKKEFSNDDYEQTSQNKLVFTCKICKSSPSTDIHSFALHMSDHNERNMNECIVCDKTFNSVVLWTAHMTNHRQQIDLNVSTVLKSAPSQNENNIVVKVNDESQIEHCNDFEIVHSSIDGNSNLTDIEHLWFSCDVCQKKFSAPSQLIFHRKIHYGIVPYLCKICNRSYQSKFQWNCHLKEHYKRHNSNLKSKQHNNNLKSNIREQKIESISPKDQIICRKCKKEFNSMSRWKNHMSMSKECRHHYKSYIPETASNKTVEDKTCLNTRDNTGLIKKKMDIIQQKPAIKKQNRSNHINSNKCEVCGNKYSNRANLSRHISSIHAQTSEPITCNVCLGTFKHKFSYREHLRTKHRLFYKDLNIMKKQTTYKRTSGQIISVNKKNKYICKICKVEFADNITLQKHTTEVHTLYKCNDCGQQFETNLSLGNHIWVYHDDISTSDKN